MTTSAKRLAGLPLLLALLAAQTTRAAVTETRNTVYVYDSKGQLIGEIAEPTRAWKCRTRPSARH